MMPDFLKTRIKLIGQDKAILAAARILLDKNPDLLIEVQSTKLAPKRVVMGTVGGLTQFFNVPKPKYEDKHGNGLPKLRRRRM